MKDSIVADRAVSHERVGPKSHGAVITFGYGPEPKIFWSAKRGKGQQHLPLILMGDWRSDKLMLKH